MIKIKKFILLFSLFILFVPGLMAMEPMDHLAPLNQRLVSVYCSDGILPNITLENLDKITNIFPYILDPSISSIDGQPLIKIPHLFFKSKREVYNIIINLSNNSNKNYEKNRENNLLAPAVNQQESLKRPRAFDDSQNFPPVKKARVEHRYAKEKNLNLIYIEGAIVGEFCEKRRKIPEDDYIFGLDIRQRTKFACPIKGCAQEAHNLKTLTNHVKLDHIKCLRCGFVGPQRKFTSHLIDEHALFPCNPCIEEDKKIRAFKGRLDLQDHKNHFHLYHYTKERYL